MYLLKKKRSHKLEQSKEQSMKVLEGEKKYVIILLFFFSKLYFFIY